MDDQEAAVDSAGNGESIERANCRAIERQPPSRHGDRRKQTGYREHRAWFPMRKPA